MPINAVTMATRSWKTPTVDFIAHGWRLAAIKSLNVWNVTQISRKKMNVSNETLQVVLLLENVSTTD